MSLIYLSEEKAKMLSSPSEYETMKMKQCVLATRRQ